MAHKTIATLCIGTLLLVAACGNETAETPATSSAQPGAAEAPTPAAPPAAPEPTGPVFRTKMMGMEMVRPLVAKTLTAEGVAGMTIQAPDNATVETSRGNNRVVSAGVNYSVAIRTGAFNPAQTKQTFGIVDPEGTVVVDEPDLVIYQRSGANGSLLFGAGVTVGESQFSCGTVATAFPFTRDQVDQMVTSCRTLAAAAN